MGDQKPDNLIPPDKMADVLTEIHLAESRVSRLNLRSLDSSNLVYQRLEGQIFKKFAVDTSAYRKSYAYYSSHPVELEGVYKQVTEKLQKKIDAGKKGSKRPTP
ncbi:DUF4296 domain-containing protein [Arsenicibacter rosenii]|nr:DUF4296 domain-containing protein [Arsenicibacter rosenii]